MRNKILKLLILTIAFLPLPVFAECTKEAENILKVKANSTSITYEHPGDNIFNIVFGDLAEGYYIEEFDHEIVLDYETENTAYSYTGGMTYTFYYYGSKTSECPETLLRVQNVSIPRYNVYSERAECEEYPDFDLCDKWYPGDLTDSSFETQLEYYQIKLANDVVEEEVVEEPTFFEKVKEKINNFIDKYVTNKNLSLLGFGLIIILGIYLMLRAKKRKKNRI